MTMWTVEFRKAGSNRVFAFAGCKSKESALSQACAFNRKGDHAERVIGPDGTVIERDAILEWREKNERA